MENRLLQILNLKNDEKFVVIKENHLADSSFVITHLISDILTEKNHDICFVTLHNSLEHYRVTGKRLLFDLYEFIDENRVKTIENFSNIIHELENIPRDQISEVIAKKFLNEVISKLSELKPNSYLIIDDLSHLLDIGVEIKHVINIINILANKTEFSCILGTHITENEDKILGTALSYVADTVIEVSPLKTGRSSDVTGVITLSKFDKGKEVHHFKALDRSIRIFRPGESIRYLLH